jgi:Putative Actinobacterial Holin-X, holin superfamily III
MTMLAPPDAPEPPGIGTLFSRLLDEGRDFVRAEIRLGKTVALSRVARARAGLMMTTAAVLLVPSAITTFLIGCLLGLRPLVGPFAAGLIVTIVTLGVAGLLGKLGVDKVIAAAGGDADDPAGGQA